MKAKVVFSFNHINEFIYICSHWRAAGVVDRGRLEICCTLRGTGGSNPSLSAKR